MKISWAQLHSKVIFIICRLLNWVIRQIFWKNIYGIMWTSKYIIILWFCKYKNHICSWTRTRSWHRQIKQLKLENGWLKNFSWICDIFSMVPVIIIYKFFKQKTSVCSWPGFRKGRVGERIGFPGSILTVLIHPSLLLNSKQYFGLGIVQSKE